MRIRAVHAPYVANKIAIDLAGSGLVHMKKGLEVVAKAAADALEKDLLLEAHVDAKVNETLNSKEEDIDFFSADRKQLFWMIKRKVAVEEGLLLESEERFNNLAHAILDIVWDEDLMDYSAPETRIKNIIVRSIFDYIKNQESIEKAVIERINNYKREIVPGSEEYEIVAQKLYEEELKKRGMM